MSMNDAVLARFWARMGASFGWDRLERTYGASMPDEWREALLQLDDTQYARGLKRLESSGSSYLPTLPEFLSMCRKLTEEDRISPQFRLEPPEKDSDKWDAAASRHLLAHLLRKVAMFPPEGAQSWGLVRTAIFVHHKNVWAKTMRQIPPGQIVEGGKEQWRTCMKAAEQEIARRPDANPAPEPVAAGSNWWDA